MSKPSMGRWGTIFQFCRWFFERQTSTTPFCPVVSYCDRFDPESQATTLVCLACPPRLSSVFFFGCQKNRKNPGGDTGKKNLAEGIGTDTTHHRSEKMRLIDQDHNTLNKYTPGNHRKQTCPLERDHFKRKLVFQPSFFKGHVTFWMVQYSGNL